MTSGWPLRPEKIALKQKNVAHMCVGFPGKNSLVFVVPLLLFLAGLMAALSWMLIAIPGLSLKLDPEALTIDFPFYGRKIPLTELKLAQAHPLNFTQEPELRPQMRLNGLGLPGFQAGWFLLKNRQKALLFLSDPSRAVCIPTTRGYQLIISPQQPAQFLQALADHTP